MSLKKICVAAALLALSAPAFAKQGEVCSSPAQVGTMKPLDSTTTFQCKAGTLTIAQLYEKGWKVVSVFSQAIMNPTNSTQGGFFWTVLVEKD
ncbi:hypothetical protein ABFT96_05345 [Xanthomonas campestris pv. campestris]|uniref:hypothetical protein n=2 Tax=Xanthomonas campestris TaxID=339 RepID=UPI00388DCEB0